MNLRICFLAQVCEAKRVPSSASPSRVGQDGLRGAMQNRLLIVMGVVDRTCDNVHGVKGALAF